MRSGSQSSVPRSGTLRGAGSQSSLKWRTRSEDKGLALSEAVSGYLRTTKKDAAELIEFGAVYVRGRVKRDPSMRLAGEEEISVNFPPYGIRRFYEIDPVRIIFRDRFLLAYDKEPGIPSQQVPYDAYNNLFAALLRHLEGEGPEAGRGGEEQSLPPQCFWAGEAGKKQSFPHFLKGHDLPPRRRAGAGDFVPCSSIPASGHVYAALHHRLDRETSGVLLFALDRKVNESLGRAFREGRVDKEYLAWVEGSPKDDSWSCDSDIGKAGGRYIAVEQGQGKKAQTLFRVLRREESRTFVLAAPLTGRTHQIRIHLAKTGYPVVGDQLHGARPDKRLYLHAWRLGLKHPVSGEIVVFEAPIPADMGVPGNS